MGHEETCMVGRYGLGLSEVTKYHKKAWKGSFSLLIFQYLNLSRTPEEGAFDSSPMLIICFILVTMTSSIKSQAL